MKYIICLILEMVTGHILSVILHNSNGLSMPAPRFYSQQNYMAHKFKM